MKFAIFGTGGVGGYFGGRLAQIRQDVTFIARGRHLASITGTGLRVDSIGGDFVIEPAKATDSPQSVGEVDCVIVSTKSWQLPEAIEQIKFMVGDRTMIVPLLNGIEHIDLLVESFGGRVLGGLCRISSFIAEPGHITHVGVKPYIAFGELNGEVTERVKRLKEVFSSIDGIDVDVPQDIRVAMWDKFIFICSTSGVGAVTRQPFGVIRSISESRALLKTAIEEGVRLGRAKGIELPRDLPSVIIKRIDALPETMVASMQKDIMEGKPSELEAQSGAVVRMGRALGIPVHTHEFIYASLLPMEKKAREK
ncbi:MAG TPA: 2-dehydropantoate 2-reductase [Anaerolineales bacterium]|nr:2-dehydropantoate 2-reductase [Anaerolineales bacterium]